MAPHAKSILASAVNYIEENIKSKITLGDITSHVNTSLSTNVSIYQLHRAFTGFIGIPIMEYVKNRKLSECLDDLGKTSLKIIDIALEYGFEHEQSFIRAFNRRYSITPGKFRCGCIELKITKKVNVDELIQFEQGTIYKPEFVIRPAFLIGGIQYAIIAEEERQNQTANKHGVDFFCNNRQRILNPVNPSIYYGYTKWGNSVYDDNQYITALQIVHPYDIPADMICISIPQHRYAVFKYIGFHKPEELSSKCMSSMFTYIFDDWMNKTGSILADHFRFEKIDTSKCCDDYCELDLYLPIRSS
jgi:AraC family transcriptional regulator